VEVRRRSYAAGGAANVAVNVAALGGTALLGGCLGQDAAAAKLQHILHEAGIDGAGLLATPERPTTTKTRLLAQGQQVVRMDSECRRPRATGEVLQFANTLQSPAPPGPRPRQ
jgi:bifunctional ADP-heptose synthase (sugar kinase/adenylyltransferase)